MTTTYATYAEGMATGASTGAECAMPGAGLPPALVVDGLSKRFGGNAALDGVGFDVPQGALTVILGPAGAGKTTTLRLVAGLDTPDAGTVELAGRDAAGLEPRERDIAMIFDNLALYPDKTGFQNIANPLVIRRMARDEMEARVAEVAATLQITHVLHRLPKTMSGGERQRVALGRALVRTPALFLLDEPLSSLDAKLRIELRAELKRLQRERGCTFLMATPDFNEAMAIGDTVVLLRQGRVVQVDAPQRLYDAPVDREAALFVGSPQINLLEAAYVPGEDGGHMVAAGTQQAAPAHLALAFGGVARRFELGIRPENLRLTEPGAGTTSGAITGELADIEALGLKSVLTVANPAARLRVLVDSAEARPLRLGQPVELEAVNTPRMLAFDPDGGRSLLHG
ncbi:MAG: ABC transporter ATP-binding protein [Desulfovibrio sp.]|nr:ABC transporter ATP-binding protein [Desulfovibrio sp.]